MRALKFSKYGDYRNLYISHEEIPTVSKGQLLVKVECSSLTTAESLMRQARPFVVRFFLGLTKPKKGISGACFSGTVIQDGKQALESKDQYPIFGELGAGLGSNCDYIIVDKNDFYLGLPNSLSHEQAACLCDGTITSYYFLTRLIKPSKNQRLLINGATGSLGVAAIQLAKSIGLHVTAVCSQKNFKLARSYGADICVSYHDENVLNQLEPFDYIFDCVGKMKIKTAKSLMTSEGTYLSPVLKFSLILKSLLDNNYQFAAVGMLSKQIKEELIREILFKIENKNIEIPVSKKYQFKNVIEAHEIIDAHKKTGNFILVHNAKVC